MFSEYPALYQVSHGFMWVIFAVLTVMFLFALIKVIQGPRAVDRLFGANVLGGLAISAIAVLSWALDEAFYLDIALVYAMISFLAVILLSKIYIGAEIERELKEEDEGIVREHKWFNTLKRVLEKEEE